MIQRLTRRGDHFWFRMTVPRALVSRIGLTEIKAGLRTSDRAIANVRCLLLSNAIDALLAVARLNVDLPPETLRILIRRCFQRCLVAAADQFDAATLLPINTAATIAELQDDISIYKQGMVQVTLLTM